MLEELILFGAGSEAYKAIQMLNAVNCKILFIVDNDTAKWGKEIYGIKIFSPDEMLKSNANIYISSILDDSIINQLINMGVYNRVISKIKFLEEYIERLAKYIPINDSVVNLSPSRTFLFDNMEGIGWGGVERWNFSLAENIKSKGYNSIVASSKKTDIHSEAKFEYKIFCDDFLEVIREIFLLIINNLPICIVNNWEWQVMLAACLAKKHSPDKVKIISTMHCDDKAWMKKIAGYESYFDAILCVSSDIANKMKNEFNISNEKVYYRANFIEYDYVFKKDIGSEKYIKIGYAGRLEKIQKRADLIIELLRELEKLKIKYKLLIAGEGTFFNIINEYIKENHLDDKVYLMGLLSRSDMKEFWSKQDIAINLSDFEGMSLSMLEAMGKGAVPIVTNVSGVNDIIESNYNGYVVAKEDIKNMVRYINLLNDNRNMLKYMSKNARDTVKEKCNIDTYTDYLINIAFEI